MAPVVEAKGSAIIGQPADRWRLSVQVHARSSEPEAAFSRRTHAVATIQRVLEVLPGVELSQERVEDGMVFDREHVIAGWSGVVTGSVDDVDQLRELISRLAGVAEVEMQGPRWELSAEAGRAGRTAALEAASAAARADAVTIARALGGSCGELLHATSDQNGGYSRAGEAVMTAAASRTGGQELPARMMELELAPERIDVDAHVAVTFRFVPDA